MKEAGSRLHHVALYVPDIREKLKMMQDVFGMKVTEIDGDPENPRQIWLDGGIQLIAASEEAECAIAHVALTSNGWKEARGCRERHGASVLPKGDNWLEFKDKLVIELISVEEKE